mgnify:CR=1 FL=1
MTIFLKIISIQIDGLSLCVGTNRLIASNKPNSIPINQKSAIINENPRLIVNAIEYRLIEDRIREYALPQCTR